MKAFMVFIEEENIERLPVLPQQTDSMMIEAALGFNTNSVINITDVLQTKLLTPIITEAVCKAACQVVASEILADKKKALAFVTDMQEAMKAFNPPEKQMAKIKSRQGQHLKY